MAATALSLFNTDTPVADSYEIFNVALDVDTSVILTPTNIEMITAVEVTPTNAAAGAGAASMYVEYLYGAATVTLHAAVSTTYLVKIYGSIA